MDENEQSSASTAPQPNLRRTPRIVAAKCSGCRMCLKACPTGAIVGEKRQPQTIDANLCRLCGGCLPACPFGAIEE